MSSKKFYEVLNVSENCTENELKKAYHKLSMKHHPDKNHGKEREAEIKFKEVNLAYSILKDPKTRAKYDAGLINDAGYEVTKKTQPDPRQYQQAYKSQNAQSRSSANSNYEHFQPSYKPQNAQPKRSTKTYQTSYEHENSTPRPFFHKKPSMSYAFFSTQNDQHAHKNAQIFRQQNRANYVYVTDSPLVDLFRFIQNELQPTPRASTRANSHGTQAERRKGESNHVYVTTYSAPFMEKIITQMIAQMILLEMVKAMQENQDAQEYSARGPGRIG